MNHEPHEAHECTFRARRALRGSASVLTPFGTASARFANPGENLTAATTTDTGVQRAAPLPWQQQVLKDHPDVGIAGSNANKAFVEAHRAAVASGQQFDPHALAETTLAPLYTQGLAKRGGTPSDRGNISQETQGPKFAERPVAAKPGMAAAAAQRQGAPGVPQGDGIVDRFASAGADALNRSVAPWSPQPPAPVAGAPSPAPYDPSGLGAGAKALAGKAWDATKNFVSGATGSPRPSASSPVSTPGASPVPPPVVQPASAPPPPVTSAAKPPAANPLDDEERKRRMATSSPSGTAFGGY